MKIEEEESRARAHSYLSLTQPSKTSSTVSLATSRTSSNSSSLVRHLFVGTGLHSNITSLLLRGKGREEGVLARTNSNTEPTDPPNIIGTSSMCQNDVPSPLRSGRILCLYIL